MAQGNSDQKLPFSQVKDRLSSSSAVKGYQRHILYKVLVISLGTRSTPQTQKYKLFEERDLENLGEMESFALATQNLPARSPKLVSMYSLMTVGSKI